MQPSKIILINWLVFFCLLSFSEYGSAQEKLPAAMVSLNVREKSLVEVFSIIEKQTGYKFAYSSDLIASQKKITLLVNNIPLHKLLAFLFRDGRINYTIIANQIVLERAPAPKKITISGYVKDSLSSEALAGATIYIPVLRQSTITNNYGFYSLTINEMPKIAMVVAHKEHRTAKIYMKGNMSSAQSFFLSYNNSVMQPVVINKDSISPPSKDNILSIPAIHDSTKASLNAQSDTTINLPDSINNEFSELGIDSVWIFDDMLKSVSSVSGNGDIISSIQMMPGIISGLDATSGYYVRGGNTDQNLIQLDEATLYNPSHFFGLVSILNTSAINSATLYKDGFPAQYGDNLSSVLDITMKEGNNQQTGGEIQAGSTITGFTLHGPIVSKKSSYLLSMRRSVMDLWLRPLQNKNNYNNYYFYDINAKVNYQLSANDRVYLSFYQGRDQSAYSGDSTKGGTIDYGINYGNQTLTLRWNHLFAPQVFANTSVIYNNYSQSITASQKPHYAELYSGIRDIECKTDLNYYPNPNHKISIGASLLYQTLTPASMSDSELSPETVHRVNPSNLPQKHSYRAALYMGDEIKMGSRLQLYIGGRLPVLYNSAANYTNFEPRLSALYYASPSSGIKLSYTQMHQYLHLVESYNASFPAEIWIGSSSKVKPETAEQTTIGLFKNSKNNTFQISLEGYYKRTGNQLLFGGGEQPAITSDIESMLIFGKSTSKGIELSIRKMKGNLKGWVAYTLSSTEQQFDSLNLGNSFPFANDRRHCLYATAEYNFNRHWAVSSNLVITSGRAFTIESQTTVIPGPGKGLYNDKKKKPKTRIEQNNYRLDPYNRLDLSLTYRNKRQLANRTLESEWIFSIYNVYARPNTFFAYRSVDPSTLKPTVQQVSFISLIPSLTFRLKF